MSNTPYTPLGNSYQAREKQIAFLNLFLNRVGDVKLARDQRQDYIVFTPRSRASQPTAPEDRISNYQHHG